MGVEQYPWSDNGKELLKNIKFEIEKLGGRTSAYYTILAENTKSPIVTSQCNSFFRNRTALNTNYSRSLQDKRTFWSSTELTTLIDNIALDINELVLLIPARSKNAIFRKRYKVNNTSFIRV